MRWQYSLHVLRILSKISSSICKARSSLLKIKVSRSFNSSVINLSELDVVCFLMYPYSSLTDERLAFVISI